MTRAEEKLFILDLLRLNTSEIMYSEETVINIIKQVLKVSKSVEQPKDIKTAEEILEERGLYMIEVNGHRYSYDLIEAMEEYANQFKKA